MKKVLLFVFILLSQVPLRAQVTGSSISGKVENAAAVALESVSIRLTHIPSGTRYATRSNSEGRYVLSGLRVGGPYKIEFSSVDREPLELHDIYLGLGERLNLPVSLQQRQLILQPVEVTSGALGNSRQSGSTQITQAELENLPSINRSILDFTRLSPQASGNSFAGRDYRYNNVQIDGANFNNGFGISSDPLPGGRSQPISLDALAEIQVNLSPFDVRQSGFTGAAIHAVTRSGDNTLRGSVYGFYNNQNYQGRRIASTRLDRSEPATTSNWGLRMGGPVFRDKLFFFVNFEREEDTGASASGVNLWRASSDGVSRPDQHISRTQESDLRAVQAHLKEVWEYDPGRYQGYADEARQYSTKFLARLDWNAGERHKLALRYNQVVGISHQLPNSNSGPGPRSSTSRVGPESMAFEYANYSFKNVVRSVAGEWNMQLSNRLSNEFLATYSTIQDVRTSKSDLFPFVDIWKDGSNYMSFGYELFSRQNDVLNRNISVNNSLNYLIGEHQLSLGGFFELQYFANNYVRMGTSYYRYNSVEDFLSTGSAQESPPVNFGLTYPYAGRDPLAGIRFGMGALYLQDRFRLGGKVEVSAGLRAELPMYLNRLSPNEGISALTLLNPAGEAVSYSSSRWPKARTSLSPRLGFQFDPFEDQRLLLRAGAGMFSGRIPFVWLVNMPLNAGVLQNTVEPGSYGEIAGWIGGIRFQKEPYYWAENPPAGAQSVFIENPDGGHPSSFSLVDPDFKMPKVWRASLGADYKIPQTPLTALMDVIYTRDIHAVYQFGANRASPAVRMSYTPGDQRAFFDSQTAPYNPAVGANNVTVLSNSPTAGSTFTLTAGVKASSSSRFSGSLYYTYSYAREISANSGSSGNTAWTSSPSINSPNDTDLYPSAYALPHRLSANAFYVMNPRSRFPTRFSLYYNGAHQGRFSYQYSGDFNGDGINADLFFLPRDSRDLHFLDITSVQNGQSSVLYTAQEQAEAFDAFVSRNGLEKYRGAYLPRNGFLRPWLNRFDVRLTQDFKAEIKKQIRSLQLSVDVINFGNLLNKKWGVQQVLNNAQYLLVPVNKDPQHPTFRMNLVSQDGLRQLPRTPFRPLTSYASTWKMQIGLRMNF